MRILLYGINFAPEVTGVGKYTGEMAAWLAGQGHEVRVVTAPPYYPMWKIREGYRASRYAKEAWGGCVVWRCPTWVPRRPTGIRRIIHLASFAASSLPALVRQLVWRPQVVWAVEPTLLCAPAAWLLARLCRARAWLHVQDYELDAAFELGILRGQRTQSAVLALEAWLMRRFDRVSAISIRMIERAQRKGVPASRLELLTNWVDPSLLAAPSSPDGSGALRAELRIAPDEIVALYSGTMGEKQGLELLADAATTLQSHPKLKFVFCGNGPGREELETRCAGLPNVCFVDLQPIDRLDSLLRMADVHLLPQRASVADLVMPSKLTGMLASARPVVVASDEGTELAEVVKGRGFIVPPGDAKAFAEAIESLAFDRELREQLGRTGREYAEDNLARDRILTRFEQALVELAAQGI